MLALGLFCVELLLCVLLDISIIYALLAGLALFLFYGRKQGFGWRALGEMAFSGIKAAKSILLVFLLIGVLTALWRACGTVPLIICHAVSLIRPSTLLPATFLLNCAVSMLTGTSFGTAATMGVVCMTVARSMGISSALAGGAILSGVYFGDRCSPVSTSALLISELTGTNIYENIRRMLHTALIPFLLSCVLYALPCFTHGGSGEAPDLWPLFSGTMRLHGTALLPAALLLALSVLHVDVKKAMSASIAAAFFLCLTAQRMSLSNIFAFSLWGYVSEDPEAAAMLNGGGIASMLRVAAIVCVSSSYTGIFQKTGLLNQIKTGITAFSNRITPFGATLLTSAAAGMIACNQTLTILLTHQICNRTEDDPQALAINLENTAVVIAPLVPWSIAGAVPLTSVDAPLSSIPLAFFLYLLPAVTLIRKLWDTRTEKSLRSDP